MIKEISAKRVSSSFEHVLFSNIIIGGGNTKIKGFKNRLENELLSSGLMTNMSTKCKIFEAEKESEMSANSAWRTSFWTSGELHQCHVLVQHLPVLKPELKLAELGLQFPLQHSLEV